jgi:hypothetical protein
MKQNNFQSILLCPAKLTTEIKGEIKNFHGNHKLNQFMASKPALYKILYTTQRRGRNTYTRMTTGKSRGLERQMRIRKESNINNSVSQQTSKMKKEEFNTYHLILTLNIVLTLHLKNTDKQINKQDPTVALCKKLSSLAKKHTQNEGEKMEDTESKQE